jgi:glycosyltransferase involved in cell wall biosynthesis
VLRAPVASVIIPLRGDARVIERQLRHLARQSEPGFEVLVADNGAGRGLEAIVTKHRAELDIQCVDARSRIGCGPARNVAAAVARSDLLLFCDADDCVSENWVASYVAAADGFGLATGPKASVTEADLLHRGSAAIFADGSFSRQPNTAGAVPYASGNNSAYRRDVLNSIGGFGSHNLRREDVEASWLAWLKGFTVEFVAGACVIYVQRTGAASRWRQSFGWGVGLESLRRQFRHEEVGPPPLSQSFKLGAVRALRRPDELVPLAGSIAGQMTERTLPGRYFERVRANAEPTSPGCFGT